MEIMSKLKIPPFLEIWFYELSGCMIDCFNCPITANCLLTLSDYNSSK